MPLTATGSYSPLMPYGPGLSCPAPTTPVPPITLPTGVVKSLEARIKDTIVLSTPGNKKQQKVGEEVVSIIKKLTASDDIVAHYIQVVLFYLSNFIIYIVSKMPHLKSWQDTAIGAYEPCTQSLLVPTHASLEALTEGIRHEMRHAYWNVLQKYIFKSSPLSTQCFNEIDIISKDKYKEALKKDRANIKNHKAILTKTTKDLTQQQKTELIKAQKTLQARWNIFKHKENYPLISEMDSDSCPPLGELIESTHPSILPFYITAKTCTPTAPPHTEGIFRIAYSFNDVIKDALQIILDIENETLKAYPDDDTRLYERDALLYGKLPSFIIEFFYPHLTQLLRNISRILLNYHPNPSINSWPSYKSNLQTGDAILTCNKAARFSAHAEIDILLAENSIALILTNIERERLKLPETVYTLQYIIQKTVKDSSDRRQAVRLLAKAWKAKYQSAGVWDSFTGMTNTYLKETCKAYLHVYNAGALTIEDYLTCLPLLHKNKDWNYKELRQKALAACRRELACTLVGSPNRCELEEQYRELERMPKYLS